MFYFISKTKADAMSIARTSLPVQLWDREIPTSPKEFKKISFQSLMPEEIKTEGTSEKEEPFIEVNPFEVFGLLIKNILEAGISYIRTKSETEIPSEKLSEEDKIIADQLEGEYKERFLTKKFIPNHPETDFPYTSDLPQKPKGLFIAKKTWDSYNEQLHKFIETVKNWIDEYPRLRARDAVREIVSKGVYDQKVLTLIEEVFEEKANRELYGLKAYIHSILPHKNESMERDLKLFKDLPPERSLTEEERNILLKLGKSFSNPEDLEMTPPSLIKSVREDRYLISVVQAVYEAVHLIQQEEMQSAFPHLVTLGKDHSNTTPVKKCSGHTESLGKVASREEIRKVAKEAVLRLGKDKSIKKPLETFYKEGKGKKKYEVFAKVNHYDDTNACTHFTIYQMNDLKKNLENIEPEFFRELVEELLAFPIEKFNGKFIRAAYSYNMAKILIASFCRRLDGEGATKEN